jgi:hypothetical protein
MAAAATDNQIGVRLLDRVVEQTPTVSKVWVDAAFKDDAAIHGALSGDSAAPIRRQQRSVAAEG